MKNSVVASLLGIALVSQACTGLDSQVFNQASADKFPASADELNSIVGSAYGQLRYAINSVRTCNEAASDEMVVPTRGPDWFDDGRWQKFARHDFSSVTPPQINDSWNYAYTGIAQTNLYLSYLNASTLTIPGKATTVAELRTLRAWYYYVLCDFFGRVPIITESSPAGSVAQSERKDVFTFIESELKAALPDLRADISTETYGRMTQGAAQALLAKLYINAEVYTGTARWQDCLNACDAVTKLGYKLNTDFFALFATNNQSNGANVENIIIGVFDKNYATGNNLTLETLHPTFKAKYSLGADSPWNGYATYADFYGTFANNDVRKNQWLQGVQTDKSGSPIIYNDAVTGETNKTLNFTAKINSIEKAAQNEGIRLIKYQVQSNLPGNNADNDWAILRYADVLLLKAEASLRLGNTATALASLNPVRVRAGLAAVTTLTLDEVLAERGRELTWEGWRRSDLIRYGKWEGNWTTKSENFNTPFELVSRDPSRRVFPIPATQLSSNPLLKQNPGY
jgi:hypothetical protein